MREADEDSGEAVPVSEVPATASEEGEVKKKKKKKKKKKRKQNKTAPAEENEGEGSYELPPLAWGTPPSTLNGFAGSSSLKSKKLEPLKRGTVTIKNWKCKNHRILKIQGSPTSLISSFTVKSHL